MIEFNTGISLKPFTTLRAGGPAELFAIANDADQLSAIATYAQTHDLTATYLGWGSNVLPADDGVEGIVAVNHAKRITIGDDGFVEAESGCGFQDLFLKTAQARLGGLEFAVGIPGTLGGALVSNAGAYRSNVSEFLTEIEIVEGAKRRWVSPEWMQFSYRDSVLRRVPSPAAVIVTVRMKLPFREPKLIYDEARDYQRQRIGKQPPPASAGSFFKNINDQSLADSLDNLPERLRAAGVVPAGYLIEKAGLMGMRIGGAMFARRHANFIVNVGDASATEIRRLANLGQSAVQERWGVTLEEEVLYLGDWSRYVGN